MARWRRAWFTLAPEVGQCLIAVSDDATKRLLQTAFYPSESRPAVMTSLVNHPARFNRGTV